MGKFKASILVAAVLISGMLAGCAGPTTDRSQPASQAAPGPGSSLSIASVPNLRDLYLKKGRAQ